ncbi:MAG TPA: hypothetical protein VKU19_21600 [Bryobacteraceae bacterium]|nr:hypothetical protein [Bryobacteraceae bacterium]
MADIRQQLGGGGGGSIGTTRGADAKRHVSEETRARLAAAQQQRWAGVKPVKPARQRKMSAEGKARIAEATRKRWEAYRAQKAAQGN